MIFFITGVKKFLIGGIMFTAAGAAMAYGLLSSGDVEHPVAVIILSLTVTIFGLSQIWIAYDMRKNRLSAGRADIPAKYGFFFMGYLFTAAGGLLLLLQITFGFVPAEIGAKAAVWSSTAIFLVPGIACLVIFFRNLSSGISGAELDKKESNVMGVIGASVGGSTLYAMAVSVSAVLAEKAGAGYLLTIAVMCAVSAICFYIAYKAVKAAGLFKK